MLFSSLTFLFIFLPTVIGVYYILPMKLKNIWLLLSSLFFYFYGEPKYLILMVAVISVSYVFGLLTDRAEGKARLALTIASVAVNLSALIYFKYTDFFISTINSVFNTDIGLLRLALPIGISFFTFQAISYNIDVYRKDTPAQKNPLSIALYVSLFPQLVAGPIVRYTDVMHDLKHRTHSAEKFSNGIRRFAIGLGKKVLLADLLGEFTAAFRSAAAPSTLFYWVYAAAYCLQVYFDFSGYSDMAIGIGKMFGFNFPENFNYPFISKSLSEFWRRWHMTLGGWFRDYVYFPLGGSRVGKIKLVRNLLIVWLLTGLWHGAAINFVVWGLFFFVMLTFEKLFLGKKLAKMPAALQYAYTIFFTLVSFTIFGCADGGSLKGDLMGLFGGASLPFVTAETIYFIKSYGLLLLFSLIGATPLPKKVFSRFEILEPIFIAAVLILSTACLVNGSFNPFLYFRF